MVRNRLFYTFTRVARVCTLNIIMALLWKDASFINAHKHVTDFIRTLFDRWLLIHAMIHAFAEIRYWYTLWCRNLTRTSAWKLFVFEKIRIGGKFNKFKPTQG